MNDCEKLLKTNTGKEKENRKKKKKHKREISTIPFIIQWNAVSVSAFLIEKRIRSKSFQICIVAKGAN